MSNVTPEHEFAVDWWKKKHGASGQSYFPGMVQHKDWKVYGNDDLWLHRELPIKPTDICLEIGCGYGQWMIPASRYCRFIYGFDIHPHLADKAHEKFAEHNVFNAFVATGNGYDIPAFTLPSPLNFLAEVPYFTYVYSISVFQHMPRSAVARYITQARNLCVSGARACFHFRYATLNKADGPYSDDIRVGHDGDWSVGWTYEQAEGVAKNAGWRVERISINAYSMLLIASNP